MMLGSARRIPIPLITLLTDYGTRDYYVGALKGVILSIAPQVRLVDITHEIEPFNVLHAAFVLRQIWAWFPPETIHLAIVDPGVGSERRILLGKYAGRYVVAPDNGLLTLVHRELPVEAMYVVENRRFFLPELSTTFHGRDIMAPVAAHLANGVRPMDFGRACDHVAILPLRPQGERVGQVLQGQVLHVDRFGTLATNIRREQLQGLGVGSDGLEVLVNSKSIGPLHMTFTDVPIGEAVAFIGSTGLLEIAVHQGAAVKQFGTSPEIHVRIISRN